MKNIKHLIETNKSFKYLLALLSGILTSIPMIIPQLFLLSWISLVPLIYALFVCEKGFFISFKLFLIYGIVYFSILYTWFFALHPLTWQGIDNFKSLAIVLLLWLSISIIQGAQFSLSGIYYKAVKPVNILKAITVPCIWIITEYLQEQTIWGMPWGRLALSQYTFLPAIQSASLFGSLFVSFLIVLTNSLAAYSLTAFDNKKIFKTAVFSAVLVFILNTGFGIIRFSVKDNYDNTIKAAAIQGNLPSITKWENSGEDAFSIFMDLSIEAAENGAKIIVWPETAVPVYVEENNSYDYAYRNFAKDYGVYLIASGFVNIDDNNYSSLIMYSPDGSTGVKEAYLKRHLVPFGEYVPYRDIMVSTLPFLADFRILSEDLTPSDKSILFTDLQGNKMSGMICFDSIFSHLARNDTKNGSELILIGTNDSYYGDSLNPYQHNGQAVLRAAENNRYIVRAANTGVSSIISPKGQILVKSQMDTEAIIMYDISYIETKTLYTIVGDFFVLIAFIYCVAIAIYSRVKKN